MTAIQKKYNDDGINGALDEYDHQMKQAWWRGSLIATPVAVVVGFLLPDYTEWINLLIIFTVYEVVHNSCWFLLKQSALRDLQALKLRNWFSTWESLEVEMIAKELSEGIGNKVVDSDA